MAVSSNETKVWYDIETKTPIFVDPYKSNHTQAVLSNPAEYRLPKDYFAGKEKDFAYDYDGYVLVAAMRKNFVRIAFDFRNSDTRSNVEGLGLGQIQPAAFWMCNFTRITRLIVVVRTGVGFKDGKSYTLDTPEKLDFFLKWGRILQE